MALVAASVLIGARVLGAADDTIEVWSARADLPPGEQVSENDLVVRRVHFDGDDADLYLRSDKGLPDQSTLTRGVGAGELLPKAALGEADELRQVSLTFTAANGNLLIKPGAVLDVWSSPPDSGDAGAALKGTTKLLDDVVVIKAPAVDESFGVGGTREILVGVHDLSDTQLQRVFSALSNGQVWFAEQ
ncbi:hypothetical protein ASD66_02320 [Nocardioides sp. Root151]|nr:hypothetical protein ASD30_09010 [Nocardioides sp. Root140]KQZ75229.1 hypothetical protein ASD66_02320 [Nocardioides sp. Root151]KRF14308.1 hypothetical protein ASH02_08120 [Nocardioides sp. Soil796]